MLSCDNLLTMIPTVLGAQAAAAVGVTMLIGLPLYSLYRRRAVRQVLDVLKASEVIVGRDIMIYDEEIFHDWASRGMLAIGESYMEKKWDALIPLDEVLERLVAQPTEQKRKLLKSWNAKIVGLGARIFNLQSPARAGIVGAHHYDLGNDFFKLWLDPYMQYSCAYYKGIEDPQDLDAAQRLKVKMIAEKLKLEPGMRVLDIGCGWGGLACYLAKNYQVHVTGITISNEQLKGAREWARREGVTELTSFEYQDYREMHGQFDRIVSVGMLEAVGFKNLETYYSMVARCLKEEGLALIHACTSNTTRKIPIQRWIVKYIFPNGFLPSLAQMMRYSERVLVTEDVHNFGPDYVKTLLEWNRRFQAQWKLGRVRHSDEFKRMWEYYLLYCAAGFRARTIQLTQTVYSKRRRVRYDAFR